MTRIFLSCWLVAMTFSACLSNDPCAGSQAQEFEICQAARVTDSEPDVDTGADSDSDTDADTDPDTLTGGTDPPESGETGDTGPEEPAVETGDTGYDTDPNVDDDGDGQSEFTGDCDDTEPLVRSGYLEVCDGLDNDCDGTPDDGVLLTFYEDADGDLYGNDAGGLIELACEAPVGYVAIGGDCNDTDDTIYPGAFEPCLVGPDANCDGSGAFDDIDGDGWDSCAECDDSDALNYPGAFEFCDEEDNDCDGDIDENVELEWHPDFDIDGYGSPLVTVESCTAPFGYVADDGDCDDTQSNIHPGLIELCDPDDEDEDCDGNVEDADNNVEFSSKLFGFEDGDGDGYGNPVIQARACILPAGYVLADIDYDGLEDHDCNDDDLTVYPGAPLGVCDTGDTGLSPDFNCDGTPDCP